LLEDKHLLNAQEIEAESNALWNPMGRSPVWTWLTQEPLVHAKERLKTLGNAVMPRCGRLAMHQMLRHHLK
jgi:hypothetical protein